MNQLTLGELIKRLEPLLEKQDAIKKKYGNEANVVFDFCMLFPTGFSSWRGDYSELGMTFGGQNYEDERKEKSMSITEFYNLLKEQNGKTYTGWKGGEWRMGLNTRIWVANQGKTGETGICDIVDNEYSVILVTSRFIY